MDNEKVEEKMSIENLDDIMEAGGVERYHTIRTIRKQTVADHSWGVLQILFAITVPSPSLIVAAMNHDLPGVWTGDIPAPLKWSSTKIGRELDRAEKIWHRDHGTGYILSEREEKFLKFADSAELVMFCLDEVDMGNQNCLGVAGTGLWAMKGLMGGWADPPPPATKLLYNLCCNFDKRYEFYECR